MKKDSLFFEAIAKFILLFCHFRVSRRHGSRVGMTGAETIRRWGWNGAIKHGRALSLMMTLACVIGGIAAYGQPTISREKIQANTPPDIKKEIEALYAPGFIDRANATVRLGMMGERAAPAIPFLIGLLQDTHAEPVERNPSGLATIVVQSQLAWEALVSVGKPAIPPLGEALRSHNATVARNAARALGQMYDLEAVKLLMTALTTKAVERSLLIEGLKESKNFRVIEPLLASLASKNQKVRSDAAATLQAISGETFGPNSQRWQEWWQIQCAAVLESVEKLIPYLQDKRGGGMVMGTLENLTGEQFGQDTTKWRQWLENKKAKKAK